jgi:thiol:disulfide interchange protein
MMNKQAFIALFAGLMAVSNTFASAVRDEHVVAELVSEVSAVVPGQPFWVALKLVHDEHWHTYWINDGDSGLPTKIRWELPEGFSAGPIVWPYPERIPMPPLVSFGYEGETWLLTEITPPAELQGTEVVLNANVSWLMCKEVCLPGKAKLALTLPVGERADVNPDFAAARARIPASETKWNFRAEADAESITINATPPAGAPELKSVDVFAIDKGIVMSSGDVALTKTSDGYAIRLSRENTVNALPENFRAVIVADPTMAADPARPAIEVELSFASPSATPAPERSLLLVSLFAFIGGMILNLMPCVFPVISLKILGFVRQAGEDPKAVWHHGLVFAAGVVVSFWALAALLMVLRAGGAGIGWGFQLQSPEVLVVLSLLFFTLALNLFGVFELGLSLTSAGGSVAQKQGWAGSFFSGCLATVIATPCTAPFMGVALGYALTQPPHVAMTVFTALALGMAFPYLILSRYPSLLKKLPRPGAWMETMKQFMGFLLMATVVWLFWVLSALVSPLTLTWMMLAFLLAGAGAWVLGKWDTLARANAVRWIGRISGIALLALAVSAGLQNIYPAQADSAGQEEWRAFTPEAVEQELAEGRPVFVDFTAKWCLTCQVNKLTVLRTAEIMNEFRSRGVTLFSADWTDENEMIARELAKYDRQSVPLYVIRNGSETAILPELLTKKVVQDALQKLK